ncbi:MAG TPA: heavy-metal-associated domain-containing protein, partial [Coriobacteriia bacterium]
MATQNQSVVVRLNVEGMHCHSCEKLVTASVGSVAGVQSVSADAAAGRVDVVIDPERLGTDELVDAVVKAGFRPGK